MRTTPTRITGGARVMHHLTALLAPRCGPLCLPGRNLIALSERARNQAETSHRRDRT